ncbi:transcriptional regulator, AraC family [Gottschalkia purinilytica]|uniref:Transcriptional regulator, AraC family n=1 Tax=Gottschalkia purinilytica TaxID=1503 RepID=A0A0L0W9W5_GOTPU|nr:AraC family transcriptional regulator [Gottschalkia purinilytica]KNF08324.1 transcriptional regulator, AraC family [Gottschalkia purinilytica]
MREVEYYRDRNFPVFEIKSCDEMIHSSKQHAHQELSVGIVYRGSSVVYCERIKRKVESNNAVFIDSGVMHDCNPTNINEWKFKMLYLKRDWFESIMSMRHKGFTMNIKKMDDNDVSLINNMIHDLQSNCSEIEKETILISILDYLFKIEDYFSYKFYKDGHDIDASYKIKKFIDNNFTEKISLENLSEYSGFSKYHIIRLFRQNFNTTPHEYQILLRINYAKEELKKGKNISEITQSTGFFDQSHFTKKFKQYFGITPLKYLLSTN